MHYLSTSCSLILPQTFGLNSDFSICPQDTSICSESKGPFNSLVCAFTANGCLFNLSEDPCERTDRGDFDPELRQHFIERLEFYQQNSPEPLIRYIDSLDFESVAPETFCDEPDFWCPFMEYEYVDFEDQLEADFERIWPIKESVNGTKRNETKRSSMDRITGGLFESKSMLTVLAVFVMVAVLFVARSTRCGRSCLKLHDEHTPLLISDINPLTF